MQTLIEFVSDPSNHPFLFFAALTGLVFQLTMIIVEAIAKEVRLRWRWGRWGRMGRLFTMNNKIQRRAGHVARRNQQVSHA